MTKIRKGHNIRVMNGMQNYTGVVMEVINHMHNKHLPYVDILVYDGTNKQEIKVLAHTDRYVDGDFGLIFLGEVEPAHFSRLVSDHKSKHGLPSKLKPNKIYNGLEVFVKTKKDWFTLIKTTAKMASFDGGRCSLSNITNIRRAK